VNDIDMSNCNSIRQRSHLTGTAILQTGQSPWQHIWENVDDTSFLELTGFDRHAFTQLLHNSLFFLDKIFQRVNIMDRGNVLFSHYYDKLLKLVT